MRRSAMLQKLISPNGQRLKNSINPAAKGAFFESAKVKGSKRLQMGSVFHMLCPRYGRPLIFHNPYQHRATVHIYWTQQADPFTKHNISYRSLSSDLCSSAFLFSKTGAHVWKPMGGILTCDKSKCLTSVSIPMDVRFSLIV